ncbi:MAG: hypothetical protein U0W24_17800 [Bacteroidales bacterium]
MKSNIFNHKVVYFFICCLIGVLLNASNLVAQPNLSGNWEFDKTQSSGELDELTYDGTVIMHISQKLSALTVGETWKNKDNPPFNTADDNYTLDGKEQILKTDFGTSKKLAKWSADKKTLIITNTEIQKLNDQMQEFLVQDTYSLSDDKKTLVIERYMKNPVTGETKSKKVYRKK